MKGKWWFLSREDALELLQLETSKEVSSSGYESIEFHNFNAILFNTNPMQF